MDSSLKKICGLLKSQDNIRRCGAALVLAELAPKSAEVVKALGEALPEAGDTLSACILEALQAIGSPAAVPYVMPLLHSQDMAARVRASAIVSCAGSAVVPEIRRQFPAAPYSQKVIYVDLLARIRSRETLDMLLDLLFDKDYGLVREVCEAVKRHAKDAQPPERLKFHKQVVKFLNSARVRKQERPLASALLLLGHIGRPEAAALLLKYASPKTTPYVRGQAIVALKGLDYSGSNARTVLKKIFPYLDDPSEEIVKNVLEIIGRIPAPGIKPAQWHKLLKSKHASARAFAARMLAGTDSTDNNRLLADLLRHEDNELREIAANALSSHPKAVPVLLKALTSAKDVETAWRLAKILKPHSAALDKKTVKTLAKLTSKAMLAADPLYDPLLNVVRSVDPRQAEAVLLDTGMEHKRAKRWPAAVDCLRRLLHTESFNDDVSYALSVCDLKVSKKELAPPFRAEDHALRGFASLCRRNSKDLLERLKKDKTLDAADLYYVGFHFGEGAGDERTFGEDLLKHVAKTWPRSREAKDIKARFKA